MRTESIAGIHPDAAVLLAEAADNALVVNTGFATAEPGTAVEGDALPPLVHGRHPPYAPTPYEGPVDQLLGPSSSCHANAP